jgi:hypothetical protein
VHRPFNRKAGLSPWDGPFQCTTGSLAPVTPFRVEETSRCPGVRVTGASPSAVPNPPGGAAASLSEPFNSPRTPSGDTLGDDVFALWLGEVTPRTWEPRGTLHATKTV